MQKQSQLMKTILLLLFIIINIVATSQPATDEKLVQSVKSFHKALVAKNTLSLMQITDKALSYGHSNGWVETKADLITDLEKGIISYQSYTEDSITIIANKQIANVRFVATIIATMNNVKTTHHLKVLEVWVQKSKRWVLFARQAVKA
jgi:hypothetical protein